MLDISAALLELQTKTEGQIEAETAYKWASRSLAALQIYATRGGNPRWFIAASHYRHEAIEHAALAQDGGVVLAEVLQATANAA